MCGLYTIILTVSKHFLKSCVNIARSHQNKYIIHSLRTYNAEYVMRRLSIYEYASRQENCSKQRSRTSLKVVRPNRTIP